MATCSRHLFRNISSSRFSSVTDRRANQCGNRRAYTLSHKVIYWVYWCWFRFLLPKRMLSTKIYYFCYGSNMLTKRMLINNKSAARFATAVLEGYQFCFSGFSDIWKGSTANIVPKANNHVYGVVYTMDVADVEKLDKQEIGYDAIEVQVKLDPKPKEEENGIITCRTYVQKDTYRSSVTNEPSRLYKMVILKGGEEHRLPARYMESVIEKWPDNGRTDCGPANLSL